MVREVVTDRTAPFIVSLQSVQWIGFGSEFTEYRRLHAEVNSDLCISVPTVAIDTYLLRTG